MHSLEVFGEVAGKETAYLKTLLQITSKEI